MHGSEDFLVLNVSTGHRQHLRAKAKFAKFASDRVVGQLGIVRVKGSPVAADQCGTCDAAAGDFLQAKRAVGVLHRERALGAGRHEVDLAGGKVGDVRLVGETDAMALLRLLPAALEFERVFVVTHLEIDFKKIRTG